MKLSKEPLVHFLIVGAALFGLYEWVGGSANVEAREEIVVTAGRIETLAATFAKVWQRPPTDSELQGLIDDFVREEVLYREAMAMRLDQDDTIVRRRMRQKVEFLSEDLADPAPPTDAELQSYLDTNIDVFRPDPRYTFRQVYVNTSRRKETAEADANALLAALRKGGGDPAKLGDGRMLQHAFIDQPEREVKRTFGTQFATALAALPVGEWQGPVQSGFGLHLVLLGKREPGNAPELAEVRDAVVREWKVWQIKEANEAFYQALRQRYSVTIESRQPEATE